MMPSALRQSGPTFVRNGVTITPMAQEHFCNVCGAECGFVYGDGRVCWCARHPDGTGYCAKAPAVEAAAPESPPLAVPIAEPTLF